MADVGKAFIGVALLLLTVSVARVSAQAHHVVGGWGPDLDVSSWMSGRVFSVGDKIWFKYSGTEDSIVELPGMEELVSCNLTNPIRMYTDPASHVILEKEGPRYFTSGDPEKCKNGLKLPINVRPTPEFDPTRHDKPSDFDPTRPDDEPSEFDPPFPDDPPSPHKPFPPVKPTPPYGPPTHDSPPPPYEPPVPVRPPPTPSAAAHMNVLSFVVAGGLLLCAA